MSFLLGLLLIGLCLANGNTLNLAQGVCDYSNLLEEGCSPEGVGCQDKVCLFRGGVLQRVHIPPRTPHESSLYCRCVSVGGVQYVREYVGGECIPECGFKQQSIKYLRGRAVSSDDPVILLQQSVLANGMTVAQLAQLNHIYQLYSDSKADHFYTWDNQQVTNAINFGYRMEGIVGKIAATPQQVTGQGVVCPTLRPLTQYFKNGIFNAVDHFYTIKSGDGSRATGEGYGEEGVAGFCVEKEPACGATIPLHRFWSETANDHIYVTGSKEFEMLRTDASWSYEGVECFIWPAI